MKKFPAPLLGFLALALVTAAPVALAESNYAAPDEDYAVEGNDPLEPLNRAVYRFNYVVDGVVLKPAAQIYRGVVPTKGREMVTNVLENIYAPVTVANSVLQGDPQNSFASFWRFILNSTFGVLGLFDAASEMGLKSRTTDFGQTLAIYGFGSGPYVVLPIIGPSNARDTVGRVGDVFMNPFNYIDDGVSLTIWSATAVDKRSNNMKLLDDIYSSSLDPYSTFRSGYTQHRSAAISRAKAARSKNLRDAGFQ